MKKRTISLILPAYNEEENIKKIINDFEKLNIIDEILAVDNNSSDNTKQEIEKTSAKYILEKKQGYGAALFKGLSEANSDLLVMCEPDGTFYATDIFKLLSYQNDYDCVFGTRTDKRLIEKDAKMFPMLRIGNILVGHFLEYLFWGPTLTDVGCTYKLISRNSFNEVKDDIKVIGSEFQPDLMINLILKKMKIIEIPVRYTKRVGYSKITYNLISSFKLGISMIILILKIRLRTFFSNR